MSRAVDEWIGRTPDSRPPPRVVLRIFERNEGKCHLSGVKIRPGDKWQVEHIIALINGGENRESNMAPALVGAHKIKTRDDMRIKSKNARVRKRHVGIKKPRTITAWRKFDGTPVYAGRQR